MSSLQNISIVNAIKDKDGKIDESKVTIEPEIGIICIWRRRERKLPANAIHSYDQLKAMFENEEKLS